MLDRRMFLSALSGIAASLGGGGASAQAQPTRPTRIVIGFPVGGGVDNAVRPLTVKMVDGYPAGLVIDAKPGGAGRLAAELVKNSAPDGTTMLATPDFSITLSPHIYRKLPYDPVKDFTPVGTVLQAPLVLWVGPMVPASVRSTADLLAWCKAHPKEAAFASSGSGGAPHFVGIMLSRAAGVPMLHVPYKGGAPAFQDTMAGMVPCCISTLGEVMPQLATGRVRPLAVTGAKRTRFLPDVPTLVEVGFKDIVVEPWIGILMPAGTPEPIVSRASRLLNEALKEPLVRETFARGGSEPLITSPEKFGEMVKADVANWGKIVAASGFTPEE